MVPSYPLDGPTLKKEKEKVQEKEKGKVKEKVKKVGLW